MEDFQPTTHLRNLLTSPLEVPERDQVEVLVAQAVRLIPVSRLDLVQRVSHGIRTPLAAIFGFREILENEQTLPPADRESFNAILKSEAHRLQRFIITLQTFDELRTGQFQLERSFGDILATAERAARMFAIDAASKNVNFRIPSRSLPIPLLTDHARMQLALEHLLSNALRVSPRGGQIEIHCESTETDVRISVGDSGAGIPEDEAEKIFKPFNHFARPDDNGSELGLGLTIVRSLVELDGGKIEISALPLYGTCFTLVLPR